MTEHKEYLKWLQSLKVGDKVCLISDDYMMDKKTITKVSGITKTGRIKTEFTHDSQFIEGEHKTSKWHSDNLIPVTDQIINEIEHEKRLKMIEKTNFKGLSPETITSIYEIIRKEKVEKPISLNTNK